LNAFACLLACLKNLTFSLTKLDLQFHKFSHNFYIPLLRKYRPKFKLKIPSLVENKEVVDG